ncbi:MAG: SGNH/GDSL hydrolase family protein [Ruminococcaceae bacterium]|nr:SGNH/GDSL hydrolase family protein [Oscillospiraceae bacterium]
MKIVCLGDSLTEGDYGWHQSGVPNIHEENYPYFLSQLTGAEVINGGKCGYTVSAYLNHYKQGNITVADADYILIFLGTNGTLDPEKDVQGNRDYAELITRCAADAPQSEIILIAPPHATEIPDRANFGCAPRVKKAQAFLSKFAKEKNFRLVTFDTVFSAENEYEMQPLDGLHFGREGYYRMAKHIADTVHF